MWIPQKARLIAILLSVVSLFMFSVVSTAQVPGESCASFREGASACVVEGCFVCNSGRWATQPHFIGASLRPCNTANAGLLRYNGAAIEFCNGSSWKDVAGSGPEALAKFGTLAPGRWCTSDGTQINCTASAPLGGSDTCMPAFGATVVLDSGVGPLSALWYDGRFLYGTAGGWLLAWTFDGSAFVDGRYNLRQSVGDITGDGTHIYVVTSGASGDGVQAFRFDGTSFTLAGTTSVAFSIVKMQVGTGHVLLRSGTNVLHALRFDGSSFVTRGTQSNVRDFSSDGSYIYVVTMPGAPVRGRLQVQSFTGTAFSTRASMDFTTTIGKVAHYGRNVYLLRERSVAGGIPEVLFLFENFYYDDTRLVQSPVSRGEPFVGPERILAGERSILVQDLIGVHIVDIGIGSPLFLQMQGLVGFVSISGSMVVAAGKLHAARAGCVRFY